jgi:hypothetical protein
VNWREYSGNAAIKIYKPQVSKKNRIDGSGLSSIYLYMRNAGMTSTHVHATRREQYKSKHVDHRTLTSTYNDQPYRIIPPTLLNHVYKTSHTFDNSMVMVELNNNMKTKFELLR